MNHDIVNAMKKNIESAKHLPMGEKHSKWDSFLSRLEKETTDEEKEISSLPSKNQILEELKRIPIGKDKIKEQIRATYIQSLEPSIDNGEGFIECLSMLLKESSVSSHIHLRERVTALRKRIVGNTQHLLALKKAIEDCGNNELANAEEYYNRADTYFDNREYDLAIADLDQAIELDTNFVKAYNLRGLTYSKKGEYNQAIKDFDQAICLNPNYANAYINRGGANLNKGELEQAIKDFDRAIQLDPNNVRAHIGRSSIYASLGDFDKAIEGFAQPIQNDPNNASLYAARGNMYAEKGEYENAIKDISKALELEPNNAAAYLGRATAYSNKGDYERAIEDYTRLIDLNPDTNIATAYYERGLTYTKSNIEFKFSKAVEDFDKAIQFDPNNVQYHTVCANSCNLVAISRSIAGKHDETIKYYSRAIECFQQAIKLDADVKEKEKDTYSDAYVGRGRAYVNKGDYDRAITDFGKAINLKPDDVSKAYYERGEAYLKQGNYNQAVLDFKSTLRLEPNNSCAKDSLASLELAQYKHLLQEKNKASTEKEYQELAKQFREMNGYEDTIKLADECDNQYQALKKQREEKELQKRKLEEEKQRKIEQSKQWEQQGLCEHCGGKLSFWARKCKSCGNTNYT